jgi:hypothetical protein
VPLVRSIAIYAALAFMSLTCGPAAAGGMRSGTLAVTVHVVNSMPAVRLIDAHGNVVTQADMAAAVKTKTENSVVYLVVEY